MRQLSVLSILLAAFCMLFALPAAAQGIRIDNAQGQTVYFFSEGMMYRGNSVDGKPVFMFNPVDNAFYPDNRIIARKPLAVWKDNALYREDETGNPPVFVYYNGGIHPNGRHNVAVAFLDGSTLYKGPNTAGQAMFKASGELPVPVMVFLVFYHKDAPTDYKVYAGKPGQGKVIMTIRNHVFYMGSEVTETPAFTFDPATLKIYRGGSTAGKAVYSIGKDNKLYRGDKAGDPANVLMKIDGYSFYMPGKSGEDAVASFAKEKPLFVKLYPGYLRKGDAPQTEAVLYLPDVTIAEKFFIIFKTMIESKLPDVMKSPKETKPAAADPKSEAKPEPKSAAKPAPAEQTSGDKNISADKNKKKSGRKKKKQEQPAPQPKPASGDNGWE